MTEPRCPGNASFATSVALLVLRLALGWTFILAGSEKTFGWFGGPGIDGFAKMLAGMGLPGFLSPVGWAYVAAYGELVGGLCVFLGLLTRLGALPIIASMCVAIATFTGHNGFLAPMGYALNLLIIAMCVALLLAGPGLVSLDALLFRRGLWSHGPQPLGEPGRRA